MRYARYGLIAILLNILVLPLSASAVNLQELIDLGGSINGGDKVFTNFSGSLFSSGALPLFLGDLQVVWFSRGDSLTIFPINEPGAPSGFSGIGFLNLEVGFDVTVTAGHNAITSIGVGIPFVFIPASGDVSAAVSARGAAASVFASGPFAAPLPDNFATLSSPATSIHVETRLGFAGSLGPNFDFLQFPQYDISFVQSESVPEPSMRLLLVLVAGVVVAIAHKIRQA